MTLACILVTLSLTLLGCSLILGNVKQETTGPTLTQTATTKLPLEKNLAVGISGSYNSASDTYFSLVNLKIGVLQSNQLNGQDVKFSLNLTQDGILIVNSSTEIQGFGMPCSPDSQCYAPAGFPDSYDFNHASYNTQNATALLRFKEQALPQAFTPSWQKFQLGEPFEDWYHAYGNIGVLGLSPRSLFWSYLLLQYLPDSQNSIVTSVSYAIKNSDYILQPSQAQLQSSFLTIDGRYSTNPMVIRDSVNISTGVWLYQNVNIYISPNLSYNNTTICVDNNANYYLMFESQLYQDVLSEFNMEVCGQTSQCNYSNSNLQDVLGFKVRFPDAKNPFGVQFTGEELIQFDTNGNPLYGLGDLYQTGCDGKAQIGVGRWFLTKAEFSVIASTTGNSTTLGDSMDGISFQVGFSQLYLQAKSTKALLIIFIVAFGLIVLMVLIVVCIQVVPVIKKRMQMRKQQAAQQEPPVRNAAKPTLRLMLASTKEEDEENH